ncbi:hypothetical protein CLF_112782, partial [Clonorchis sinensis]
MIANQLKSATRNSAHSDTPCNGKLACSFSDERTAYFQSRKKRYIYFWASLYASDAIQSSNHGYIPRSQRQILRGQIRGGRRTERHREAYSFVVDGAEAIEDEVRSRAGPLSAQVTDPLTSKPCDGFLHAAVSVVHVSPLNVGSKLSMVLVDHLKDHCTRSAGSPVINASTPADIFSFIVEVGEEQLRSATQDELSVLEAFKSTCIEDGNVELIPEINYMVNQLEASLKGPSSFFQTDCQFEVPLELSGASKNCHAVDSPPSEIDAHNRIYQCMRCLLLCLTACVTAADGQPIFLDGLMWKCLLAEYGSVAELPGTLDVTVTSLKTYKMNP